MNDMDAGQPEDDLVMEYDIDAPPEKVWRAISMPAFRERWLPQRDLADAAPVSAEPGEQVSYRMRDAEPPFLESIVTFQIGADAGGSTRLRIVHRLVDTRAVRRAPPAANHNGKVLMLAA